MVRITCFDGLTEETKEFAEGSSWEEAANAFFPQEASEILLVHEKRRNQIFELHKHVKADSEVRFLSFRDAEGRAAYARSALLMLLKAFYREVPAEDISGIAVEFTIGGNFYIVPRGSFALTEELLSTVEERMREYARADLPFMKQNVATDEGIRLFRAHGMPEKAKLLRFRRASRVNMYSLDGFMDYFYGPMCIRTGKIAVFALKRYAEGFVLLLPKPEEPKMLSGFKPSEKLFRIQNESFQWADKIGLENIADLNGAICRGEANDLILMQEAFFEKKIGEIAQRISKKDKKILLLAGPSSSGKTTTAHRLALQLRAYGIRPHIISADNYFKDYDDRELDEFGNPDFESIRAVDTDRFNRDMLRLLSGEAVTLPKYNFITGKREESSEPIRLLEDDVLIIEGIHCLNEAFSAALPKEAKYKIYVSALTQLNIDEHNRIPTTDCRLLRRMVRDSRTRGYSARDTIRRWPSVRAGEEQNIFPYQEEADVIFNTAMIYEIAVIKQYAEPLLFSVPQDAEEYPEARRLLKFLDYVLSISPEIIPGTSILREFIGGSCIDAV